MKTGYKKDPEAKAPTPSAPDEKIKTSDRAIPEISDDSDEPAGQSKESHYSSSFKARVASNRTVSSSPVIEPAVSEAKTLPASRHWSNRVFPTLPHLNFPTRMRATTSRKARSAVEAINESTSTGSTADREAMFLDELLDLFRGRIHFLSSLAIVLLPFFALLHAILSPQLRVPIGLIHFCLIIICVMARVASPHVKNLFQARLLTLTTYVLVSFGVAIITVQLSDNDFGNTFQNQFIAYSSYNEIVLSVLLLPFSVWECLTVIAIVFILMFWSAYWTTPIGLEPIHYSHMLMLLTSAVVVMCVARFQALLRRQAFDSTYDLAHTATQMELLSTLDVVTGGFNRHYLERSLDIEIARAARFARPLSLIMFDLDNFKDVNDECGHAAGDEVLRQVLTITTETIREIDTAVRYGGDEFVILLPETDEAATQAIAERLQTNARQDLVKRFGNRGPEGRVTLSIGILTVHLSEPVPINDLIERVDERLYEAKRSGKNCIAA